MPQAHAALAAVHAGDDGGRHGLARRHQRPAPRHARDERELRRAPGARADDLAAARAHRRRRQQPIFHRARRLHEHGYLRLLSLRLASPAPRRCRRGRLRRQRRGGGGDGVADGGEGACVGGLGARCLGLGPSGHLVLRLRPRAPSARHCGGSALVGAWDALSRRTRHLASSRGRAPRAPGGRLPRGL
ncbi:hypothetical protein T492DRAFT_1063168 [Pavlovales sp. CCMP2436]|nr:hypothetical protein T492DRAFT_1063168 [Pavlovales sp. CCMP2436]